MLFAFGNPAFLRRFGGAPAVAGVSSIAQGDIVFPFSAPAEAGNYFCGTAYVVGETTLNEPTPAPTGSGATYRSGAMLNPLHQAQTFNSWWPNAGLAFDGRTSDFQITEGASFPLVAPVNSIVVKSVSRDVVSDVRAGLLESCAVLHVAPSAPASATHIAPAPWSWAGRSAWVSRNFDVDAVLALLPNLSTSGMSVPADLEDYLVGVEKYNATLLATNIDHTTAGYELYGVAGYAGPEGNNYGYRIQTAYAALIGIMLCDFPEATKRRAIKAIGILGSWCFDMAEGHPDRPQRTNAGAHWLYNACSMIIGLVATGRTARISDLPTIRPENQFSLPFLWTAPLLARCVPHSNAEDPFPWRIRTVSAIDGLNVSINRITGDNAHFGTINMIMKNASGGAIVGKVVTVDPGVITSDPIILTLDAVVGLSVSDEIYLDWAAAPAVGDADWCIGGLTDFHKYSWSRLADYRLTQIYASDVMLIRALGVYGDYAEALEKYAVRANRADDPVGNDYANVFPTHYGSPVGTWWQQIWTAHAETVGVVVDVPPVGDPPLRGWYFDGVEDRIGSESGVVAPGASSAWLAMTMKLATWPTPGRVVVSLATAGGSGRFFMQFSNSQAMTIFAWNSSATNILSNTFSPSTFPLDEWFTVAAAWNGGLATPTIDKYLWRKSTGLWTTIGNNGTPTLVTGATETCTRMRAFGTVGGEVEGDLSSVVLKLGQWIDLTDADVRAKLVPGAVGWGANGSGMFGATPDLFLAGDTFHVNKGIGGGLGLVGELTASADLPA